ncbi:acyl-CoA dehydrogenase [Salinibacterium sp. ZJ450]|uniref:acyl-CoA dehydrogenase family protein n=1 Tax=Salinibacterium sp. ZJ450 TaxID=2708338 RepID=UPI00141D875C|nr:acyl-CoA dehydrogenase [Salinibacterium sp. ZJ450]
MSVVAEIDVVAALRRLAPELERGEQQATTDRMLTSDTWKLMQDLGILRGLQPARWGGGEISLRNQLTHVYELARHAPSAGWVAGVVGSHPWQIALFPEETQQELWGDNPAHTNSSSYAPTGKVEKAPGGYRVNGRWSFSSGGDHCQAVILGGNAGMFDIGGFEIPNYGSILLLGDQYKLEDTWHTAGLKGTGSKDVVVDDQFVPEHRFLSHPKYEYNPACPPPGFETNESTLYRLPWAVMFNLVLVAPVLGLTRRFLDQWAAETTERRSNWGGSLSDDPLMQMHLANAEWVHDAAVKKMFEAVDTITQAAEEDVYLERPERARIRWNITKSCQEVGQQVNHLVRVSSGRTAFIDHPLHKLFQDVTTALGHAFLSSDAVGQYYGASLLNTKAPEVML